MKMPIFNIFLQAKTIFLLPPLVLSLSKDIFERSFIS